MEQKIIVSFLPAVCVWTCVCVFQKLKHKIFVKEEITTTVYCK